MQKYKHFLGMNCAKVFCGQQECVSKFVVLYALARPKQSR
jgi:hypothetical protein